jgi:hypothetical protein
MCMVPILFRVQLFWLGVRFLSFDRTIAHYIRGSIGKSVTELTIDNKFSRLWLQLVVLNADNTCGHFYYLRQYRA